MRPSRAGLTVCALVALLVVSGCSSVSSDRAVTVLASWTGAEETAFRKVLAAFTQQTGIAVDYQGTRAVNDVVAADVQSGRPPDIGILPAAGDLARYARTKELVPLRDVLGNVNDDYSAAWRRLGEVGQDDTYAVPVKANLKNLVWYRKNAITGQLPTTVPELASASSAYRSKGREPWCLGMSSPPASGWPGTDWIEDLLLQRSGTNTYQSWASGRVAWTAAPVRDAWATWGAVVGATGPNRSTSAAALLNNFTDAAKPMFASTSGCLLEHQASFMEPVYAGYSQSPVPGTDFDFFTVTANSSTRTTPIVSADLAGLFNDTPEARELVRFLAEPDGQRIWPGLPRSGAFSASSRVGDDTYSDAVGKRIAATLSGAETVCYDASDTMPTAMTAAFERAVMEYLAAPDRLDDVLAKLEIVRQRIDRGEWLNFQCVS